MRVCVVKTPAVREHVHVEGQKGEFLVIWVDWESETAQVVPLPEGYEVLSVPFGSIRQAIYVEPDARGVAQA